MPEPEAAQPLGGEHTSASMFLFEVDGVEIGTFREVSGLRLDVSVTEHVEGGQNGYVHKLPGVMRWPNVTLTRGMVQSDALFEWAQKSAGDGFAGAKNTLTRATGAITVIDSLGKRLRAWELQGVFAVAWSGPVLASDNEEALSETLELAHNGFRAVTK